MYGKKLLNHYGSEVRIGVFDGIVGRYLNRVRELLQGVYPEEEQPAWMAEWNEKHKAEIGSGQLVRAERYVWSYLFARTISCPSCGNEIPLSPNWRLESSGKGVHLLPNERTGVCDFEIVETVAQQSAGTVKNVIATCPYPDCGATTPKGYIAQEAQVGRLGHRIYAVIMRDQWQEFTKAGVPKKRLTTERHFRAATPGDNNLPDIQRRLSDLRHEWDVADILPSEAVPFGNDNRPHTYAMSPWRNMFSPRQQLAHGYCVQAFQEMVDKDVEAGELDDARKAAWCFVALGLDKVIHYNNLLARWHPGREVVASIFDSHDFGMKWSYSEMAIGIEGLGLEWGLKNVGKCIDELVEMSGHTALEQSTLHLEASEQAQHSTPTEEVTTDPADFLLSLDDKSVDAIVFDPPYYDNVSYAELSDFFYVWLKRTAGYIYPEWFSDLLTDKDNEAIASPVRFESGRGRSMKAQAYEDYVERMRNIFAECRRIIKDAGIMTIMFTHKTTDAWDALTVGIIQAGFRITATWPVKTESDSSLNIRDRAAARSTILLVCRPKHELNATGSSWESVQQQIRQRVAERLPQFREYGLTPLDTYLAAFGPALEVISSAWPIARDEANPLRPNDPFSVIPNDALEVARDVAKEAEDGG
ncbi:MAG: DNA methyltransferase, partial [Dehalococcoidia bacterium]|nr:DNA methyltransferase [Dehalococcoidia bacterium]